MNKTIKMLNEGFIKKFVDETDGLKEDIELTRAKKQIKECIRRLNESPMSDEDRAENEILVNLQKKMDRAYDNYKTPYVNKKEKEILDKYGIDYPEYGDTGLGGRDVNGKRFGAFRGGKRVKRDWRGERYNEYEPNFNAVDQIRKSRSGERDYARSVEDRRNWLDDKRTFQDLEREAENAAMSAKYGRMKHLLKDREDIKNSLDYNDRDFNRSIDSSSDWHNRRMRRIQSDRDANNAIINKLMRKESVQSELRRIARKLNEAPMSDEDREESAVLRKLLQKMQRARGDVYINKKERAILDKYGYDVDKIYGDNFLVRDDLNHRIMPLSALWKDDPNRNYADMLRKAPQRRKDYGRGTVASYESSLSHEAVPSLDKQYRDANANDSLSADAVWNYRKDTSPDTYLSKPPRKATLQDWERAAENARLRKNYSLMKAAVDSNKELGRKASDVKSGYAQDVDRISNDYNRYRKRRLSNLDDANAEINKMLKKESYKRKKRRYSN